MNRGSKPGQSVVHDLGQANESLSFPGVWGEFSFCEMAKPVERKSGAAGVTLPPGRTLLESKVYTEENQLRNRERPIPVDFEHLDPAVLDVKQALGSSATEITNLPFGFELA